MILGCHWNHAQTKEWQARYGRRISGLSTTTCCKCIYLSRQVLGNLNPPISDGDEDLVKASEEPNMSQSSLCFVSDTGLATRHQFAQSKRGEGLHR